MKKYLFTALLLCFSICQQTAKAAVTAKAYIKLGPVGDTFYADGAVVSDSEQYVVIFTADGYSFAGFTTDASGRAVLAEPEHSVVATYGTNSEIRDGIEWTVGSKATVQSKYLDKLGCTDGSFELYLLDTRTKDGFAPVDNEGEDATNLPTTINAWAKATGSNVIKASALNYNKAVEVTGSITTEETTVIGTIIPVPVIVSLVCTNGVATVEATNTVSTAKYNLTASVDLAFTNVWTAATANGASSVTDRMTISDPSTTNSAAFYRLDVVK